MPSVEVENPLEIVDISEINQSTAEQLLHAASTQGFLMIEGHGFSQAEVDELFGLSKKFFDLPYSEKMKHKIDTSNRGYTGVGVENLEEDELDKAQGDPKEAFNFANLNMMNGEADQEIPEIFLTPENREIVPKAVVKFRETLQKLLVLLAMGLKIDENEGGNDWFTSRHAPEASSGSAFRLLHYPSPTKEGMTPEELEKLGEVNVAGAHTDYGCVTLLLQRQDEDGLEILSPVSRKWEPVPFVPASDKYLASGQAPPLIVNIADQLCYWTNGLLKSTVHRVRFPRKLLLEGKPRYSIVLFAHPNDKTLLEPVPAQAVSQIEGRGAAHYLAKHGQSMTAGEHLAKRLASTYGGRY